MAVRGNIIRTFALICTAITSAFLLGIAIWLISLLAAPNWCQRAMGAVETVDGMTRPEFAVSGCFQLLNRQVEALAVNSHIAIGVLAVCLAVLIVIVIAGGRLSFKANATGVEGAVGGNDDPAVEGARRVEDAATAEREQVEEEVADARTN